MTLFTGDWLWSEEKNRYEVAYVGEELREWSGGAEFLVTRPVLERIASDQDKLAEADPVGSEGGVYDRVVIAEDGTAALVTAAGDRYEIAPRPDGLYEIGFGWCWGAADWDEVSEVVGAETRKETLPDGSAVESLWLPGAEDPWLVRETDDSPRLNDVDPGTTE